MDGKKKLRLAIISGASHALKYRERHPSSDEEVLQYVTREAEQILRKVGRKD